VPGNSESTACASETLYRVGKLSSREIAGKLHEARTPEEGKFSSQSSMRECGSERCSKSL
jgi:hypothetical protein